MEPSTKTTNQSRRHPCCCRYEDCREIQEALAAADHELHGFFTFKTSSTAKNTAYQSLLVRNLHHPTSKLTLKQYQIAKFHWEASALRFFEGEHTDGNAIAAPRYPTTPVADSIASANHFKESINEWNGKYFWPPRNNISHVRSIVDSLSGKSWQVTKPYGSYLTGPAIHPPYLAKK